jgi:hypothetical protein
MITKFFAWLKGFFPKSRKPVQSDSRYYVKIVSHSGKVGHFIVCSPRAWQGKPWKLNLSICQRASVVVGLDSKMVYKNRYGGQKFVFPAFRLPSGRIVRIMTAKQIISWMESDQLRGNFSCD